MYKSPNNNIYEIDIIKLSRFFHFNYGELVSSPWPWRLQKCQNTIKVENKILTNRSKMLIISNNIYILIVIYNLSYQTMPLNKCIYPHFNPKCKLWQGHPVLNFNIISEFISRVGVFERYTMEPRRSVPVSQWRILL